MNARFAFAAAALAAALAFAGEEPACAKRVDVTSDPEGASVSIDGVPRGRTPLALHDVAPGDHHVRFTLAGHDRADAFFSVGAGGYCLCHEELAVQKGLLLLTTEPAGCSVTADGYAAGETPCLVTTLDVTRRHRIQLKKTGYQPRAFEVAFDGRMPVARHERLVLDSGEVSVASEPAGAKVTVDGIERGVTPLVVGEVPRGRLKVSLSMEGYRPATRDLNVKPGDRQELFVRMEELPGTLFVSSDPAGARIFIDGKAHGRAPVEVAGVAPGEHVVAARLDGHDDVERRVAVPRGGTAREEIRLECNLGRIEVRTDPVGASVLVDGKPRGTTTAGSSAAKHSDRLVVDGVPAGEHKVIVRCHGYAEAERSVTVEARGAAALDVRLKRLFTPDVRIETPTSSYVGVFLGGTAESVRVETAPGVVRTFPRSDVRILPVEEEGGGK